MVVEPTQLKKYLSKWVHLPPIFRGEQKKVFETTTKVILVVY